MMMNTSSQEEYTMALKIVCPSKMMGNYFWKYDSLASPKNLVFFNQKASENFCDFEAIEAIE